MAYMLQEVYDLILKNGVRKYKARNSKFKPLDFTEKDCKHGSVFLFRRKEDLKKARGVVVSSEEAILENSKCSHWTPNVFSWGGYCDRDRKYVRGHFERNLQQVNTFVIDIDSKKQDANDIMLAGVDIGVIPTLVLETTKGYQAYFVLEEASFISSANDYKSLRTAQAIAHSLKYSFSKAIEGVDLGCNSLGIFRMPSLENIRVFSPGMTHSFKMLMTWSMKIASDIKEEREENREKIIFREPTKQVNAAWFKELLSRTEIKGNKGVFGRNSAIFTASLACFSSEIEKDEALKIMDEFNTYLSTPLNFREVEKAVESAYSGKYQGAHKDYIKYLCETWDIKNKGNISSKGKTWYKFAKPRSQRKRSHLREWRKDLLNYVNKKTKVYNPYVQLSMQEIHEEIKIPVSTLKKLIKELVQKKELYVQTKKGKNGYTKLATDKSIALTLLKQKKTLFNHYKKVLERHFPRTFIYTNKLKMQIDNEPLELLESKIILGDTS